jgi:predicted ABC-type ATPase
VGQAPTRDIGTPDLVWGQYGTGLLSSDWWETSPDLIWPQSNTTYAKMRHDPQLKAVMQAYTLPIMRATWAVEPAGCRDEVVQLVADDLGLPILGADTEPGPARRRGVIWQRHLRIALQNLIYGHMPFELRYRIDSTNPGGCHLDHLGERLPHTIANIVLNHDCTIDHITQNSQGSPIPANRLLWYVTEQSGANWAGNSMLRPAYGAWLIKHEMWRVHGTSIRRFGMGVPYVEAPPGATAAQVAQARDMASAMRAGEQSGAGVPQGFRPMLMGLTGSVPDAMEFIRYLDQAMAKMALAGLIELGQTETGSRALGETFLDLFLLSLQAVADEVATTATSGQDGMPGAVVDLVTQNWGEDEAAPRLVCTDVGENYQVTAEALSTLVTAKALTPDAALEDWIRKTWRLPESAGPISPLAKPPPPKPVSPGGNAQPGPPGVSPPASGSPAGQPPAAVAAAVPAGPGHRWDGATAAGDQPWAGWSERLHPRDWAGRWMFKDAQPKPGRGGMPGRGSRTGPGLFPPPPEPRGFHGHFPQTGIPSDFTYDGPAGGDGHMRAVLAVADIIAPQPGGQDIAADVRASAHAMYQRDMAAAYRHLDGAIYLDGIYAGEFNRPDLEAIRRSYADVPLGAVVDVDRPTVPPELGTHQRRLKGRPVAPGLVGAEAGDQDPKGGAVTSAATWTEKLHPRDDAGKFAHKPGGYQGLSPVYNEIPETRGTSRTKGTYPAPTERQAADQAAVDAWRKGHPVAPPITEAEARDEARAVSAAEFQGLAREGLNMIGTASASRQPTTGLDENWDKIKSDTYAKVLKPWGGATINPRTGAALPDGADEYALTVKPHGMDKVSVPEGATEAEFSAAMDTARARFARELTKGSAHLGVFHDDDEGRIDIDPVMVVGTPHEVEAIGAYTHAIGGAYHFKTGDGFFPPYVREAAAAAMGKGDLGRRVHYAGPGQWRTEADQAQAATRPPAAVLEPPVQARWDESLHPRGDGGRFAHVPGGGLRSVGLGPVGNVPEHADLAPGGPTEPGSPVWRVPADMLNAFGVGDTLTAHTRPDGTLSPERAKLHRKLIDGILAGHRSHDAPEITFMGGGPGAGKSTVLGKPDPDTVLINSDEVKPKLPEYGQFGKQGAVMTHMESAAVAYRAQDEAMAAGYNIAVDGVGDTSPAKMAGWVRDAKDQGYITRAKYVTTNPDIAAERAKARGEATGRWVPETVIRQQARSVAQVFPELVKGDLLDEAELWNNDGAKPKLVGQKRADGPWQILDQAAWQQFLAMGGQ